MIKDLGLGRVRAGLCWADVRVAVFDISLCFPIKALLHAYLFVSDVKIYVLRLGPFCLNTTSFQGVLISACYLPLLLQENKMDRL